MGTATYVGGGSRHQGQNGVQATMGYTAGAKQAGDRHLLIGGWKRPGTDLRFSGGNASDGQGNTWTKVVDRVTLGTGADGVDTGQMRMSIWEKPYAVGETSPTVGLFADSISTTTADGWSGWIMTYRPAAGEVLSFSHAGTGQDTTSGTTILATTNSDVPFDPGDIALAAMMVSRDDVAPSQRWITIQGTTLSSVLGRVGAANTAGNDSWLGMHDHTVNSGSAAIGATLSGGASSLAFASTGGVVFLRVRSEAPAVTSPWGVHDGVGGRATATLLGIHDGAGGVTPAVPVT